MHLKYILRQVEPDRGYLRHDRSPLWILADPPWHIDAVGGRSHHQSHASIRMDAHSSLTRGHPEEPSQLTEKFVGVLCCLTT
jgi:hypothetical protein